MVSRFIRITFCWSIGVRLRTCINLPTPPLLHVAAEGDIGLSPCIVVDGHRFGRGFVPRYENKPGDPENA